MLHSVWKAERDSLIVSTQTACTDTAPIWLTGNYRFSVCALYDCTLDVQTPCAVVCTISCCGVLREGGGPTDVLCKTPSESLRLQRPPAPTVAMPLHPTLTQGCDRTFPVVCDLLNFLSALLYAVTSGDVVTLECVEKLIRKDMICPITGQRLKESDIIVMQRGGTGFAATGLQMQATKEGAAMTV